MAASPSTPSRVVAAVVAVVCVALMIQLSSSSSSSGVAKAPTTTEPIRCRDCDKACKKSCKGNTSFCSVPCGDPSNVAGCESCKEAYYYKCLNYCGSSCSHICVN